MAKTKQHLQTWANGSHVGSIPVESKDEALKFKKDLAADAADSGLEYEFYYQTLEKL